VRPPFLLRCQKRGMARAFCKERHPLVSWNPRTGWTGAREPKSSLLDFNCFLDNEPSPPTLEDQGDEVDLS